jgi:hypothetical protein
VSTNRSFLRCRTVYGTPVDLIEGSQILACLAKDNPSIEALVEEDHLWLKRGGEVEAFSFVFGCKCAKSNSKFQKDFLQPIKYGRWSRKARLYIHHDEFQCFTLVSIPIRSGNNLLTRTRNRNGRYGDVEQTRNTPLLVAWG